MRTKILELKKERKLTKTQMARDIDVTPQHLNAIIRGKSNGSEKFWRNFAKAFDLTINEIELYKQEG